MLSLKAANLEDMEKEYTFITQLPENENGFMNRNHGISKEDFMKDALPKMIDYAKGATKEWCLYPSF